MKTTVFERMVNPFIRIAGMKALIWGLAGMLLSTWMSWMSGYHYHGLLHFGPAPNPAWWCYLVEHLIVWLVPAALFYLGGLLWSPSRIRAVDVWGTVLFAQLPLLGMNAVNMLSAMQALIQMDMNMPVEALMKNPDVILGMIFSLVGLPFLIITLIWMFKAVKVSCNLKGAHLWITALVGIIGGDILCRILISLFY